MRNWKFVLISVLALALLVPTAFAQVDPSGSGLTIGFAQVGSESAWRTAFSEAVIAEAEARGINLLFSDGQQRQENQIAAIRSFIAQGVDAIILAPVVETGWDEVLQEAADNDIPVVIVDRNVTADRSLWVTRVSSDFVHEGRLAAAWLAQATAGDCDIVELQGTVGSSAALDRQQGFNEVIALFDNMEIVLTQSGDFTRTGGKEVMESFLNTMDPADICAVWAHNDDMLIGATQAMEEAGIDPGDDILTISVDAIPDIFLAMAEGKANATVELSPNMGGPAFDAVVAYLNGETLPDWIPVAGGIYFPDTAMEEYEARSGGGE
ncbi:ABC transporter substrate-binding protein [Phototrophicus methaneseepsis]|uniref:ABC transporter substrate-binding protein n=1 Tax=Phototrophicus methaneseepsis TaxID=2710758 RepID=A0A7S8EBF5_9CHLR|nr:ABC transporter substrate-binding protein [Phototrophicus methaneseepsis]QPC83852.1 ABC transporter substrate-binding protein [Phototrophicus methaneseepsis]